MGKHAPRWVCPLCGRYRVKDRDTVCWRCLRTDPRLPNVPTKSESDRVTPMRTFAPIRGAR